MSGLILAIETSIKNGSLSLLNGTQEIDGRTGNDGISRSEDLLPQIKYLLDQNNLSLSQLETIAVSTGPGSFTGLRVGIATAKALALSVNCRLTGVSLLAAMAGNLSAGGETIVVAAAGRGLFFWQRFQERESAAGSKIEMGDESSLKRVLNTFEAALVLMEPSSFEDYRQTELNPRIQIAEGNFARLIGLQAARNDVGEDTCVFPQYLRPAIFIN